MHIMKTAGMAINEAISKFFKERNLFKDRNKVGGYPSIKIVQNKFHEIVNDYDFIPGHFSFEQVKKIREFKKSQGFHVIDFTILRNPINRTISIYKYYVKEFYTSPEKALKYHGREMYELIINKKVSFDEFIKLTPVHTYNFQTRFLSDIESDKMWNKTPEKIDEMALEQAKNNLNSLKLLGVQENLEEFWSKLSDMCDWDIKEPLTIHNSSSTKNIQIPEYMSNVSLETISENTKNKIVDLSYYDMKIYDYCLELISK